MSKGRRQQKTKEDKEIFDDEQRNTYQKLVEAFELLQLKYKFQQKLYESIDVDAVQLLPRVEKFKKTTAPGTSEQTVDEPSESVSETEFLDTLNTTLTANVRAEDETEVPHIKNTNNDSGGRENNGNPPNLTTDETESEGETMVQTKESFLKTASGILSYKFNGDPTKRDGFIADVELVENVAEDANKATCFKFVKARLEGKALEALSDNVVDVQGIIAVLKKDIKNEPSEVIEGRFAALRLEKGNFVKFTELAEKQVEAYRRSLVNEGISKTKAQELAVRKTVELCRKTARSEVVNRYSHRLFYGIIGTDFILTYLCSLDFYEMKFIKTNKTMRKTTQKIYMKRHKYENVM